MWRAFILDEGANPKISEWIGSLHEFLVYPELLPAIISIGFIGFAIVAGNYILDKGEMKKRVIRQDDDALEVTILNAFLNKNYLLVSLDNGKVYVGKVSDTYFRIDLTRFSV